MTRPVDLTPAEPEPPTLLDDARLRAALGDLNAALNCTPPSEED